MHISGMKFVSGFALGLCVILFAGYLGWVLGLHQGRARAVPASVSYGPAPKFNGLINQFGQRVNSSEFAGKIQIVTFLFPYCDTYCPLIASHLIGLESLLKAAKLQDKVVIVAFNVDPAHTGPKEMLAFLKQYGWNPKDKNFQYLTGDSKKIRQIVTRGFHVFYKRVEDNGKSSSQSDLGQPQLKVVNLLAEHANVRYDVTHNDSLILIDPTGQIRRLHDEADTLSESRLLVEIQNLIPAEPVRRNCQSLERKPIKTQNGEGLGW